MLVTRWEYSKVPGWDAWYKSEPTSKEEDDLFRRFRNLRNQSQKQRPVTPELTPLLVANLVPVAALPGNPLGDKLPPSGSGEWYALSYAPPAGVIWMTVVDGQEIAASCKTYLEFLEKVVGRCEARFGTPGDPGS